MPDDKTPLDLAQDAALVEEFAPAYELLGQIKATRFFKKVVTVGDLLLIRQMKESKLYKRLDVSDQSGNVRRVGNFEEFCDLCLGVSSQKVYEDLQNLAALGEEFYAASQKMGLTYRQLRQLRAAPEDLKEEARKLSDDPEALKELLFREIDEKDKLKKELLAREKVIAAGKKRLEEAETRLDKLAAEKSFLTADEARAAREAEAREALKKMQADGLALLGQWTAFIASARGVMEAEGLPVEMLDVVVTLTSAVFAKLAADAEDSGIQVDFRKTVYPDFLVGQNPEHYAPLRGDETPESAE